MNETPTPTREAHLHLAICEARPGLNACEISELEAFGGPSAKSSPRQLAKPYQINSS